MWPGALASNLVGYRRVDVCNLCLTQLNRLFQDLNPCPTSHTAATFTIAPRLNLKCKSKGNMLTRVVYSFNCVRKDELTPAACLKRNRSRS